MSQEPDPSTVTSPYVPDLEKLREWLKEMVLAARFLELIKAVLVLFTRMREINLDLTRKIAHLKRRRPPSEKLVRIGRQLSLFGEPTKEKAKRGPKSGDRSNHPGRGELPSRLPRVPLENPVPADQRICPTCGGEMTSLGFHLGCEYLDVIPAQLVVTQRMDETVACSRDDTIVKAEPWPRIVDGGKLGDTLIVEALADKYIEHAPIERQVMGYARKGVDIAAQTLGRSVSAAIDLLQPIAREIQACTRGAGILATDASAIPILDPEMPSGIRSATMWCWTNARWVSFFYSPSGDSESVKRFLGDDLTRTVQCDGTSLTSFLERAGGKRPGCWAHGRRRFAELARCGDKIALEALELIAPLFAVERASTLAGDTADTRRKRRQADTRPVLDTLRVWVDDKIEVAAPKTPLGKALGYLDRQWKRLILFLDDGDIEATNNRRERELRRLVLGRKNWLFTWGDVGGERTANILSIIATAISHDVNPRAYLHLVARRIVQGWPRANLRELLPDRIVVAHPDLYIGDIDEHDLSGPFSAPALAAPSEPPAPR